MGEIEADGMGEQNDAFLYLRRGSTIDAYVLHAFMDGKVHTAPEVANKLEVSAKTVRRSIERLGICYIFHSLSGGSGDMKGGFYLDEQHLFFGLSRDNVREERKRKPVKTNKIK